MEEYQTPVDFGETKNLTHPGNRDATTTSSLASSSRMASAASAPVHLDSRKVFGGGSIGGSLSGRQQPHAQTNVQSSLDNSIKDDGDGNNSFHSSPIMWNNSPQRVKSRRELERRIRHRNYARADDKHKHSKTTTTKKPNVTDPNANANLPKALADILLHTAILGIDTTAKLSKPTLALTKNTLLPQVILPLLHELWEQYAPIRLQTWMRVVPSSLRNMGDVLWDTDAGKTLGEQCCQLGDTVVDMASSEVARQCWIDVTVTLIKLMESMHTPECKALLDQYAVGMCRFVDVLSSGKAKQVWFDISNAVWAMVEVGSDPLVVMSLAEGCAQICFALERERESLKERKINKGVGGGAKHRRRERDRRQMGMYPPGREVVREGGGKEGVKDAFMASLGDYHDDEHEEDDNEGGNQVFINGTIDDGPPKVIVPNSPVEMSPKPLHHMNDGIGNDNAGGNADHVKEIEGDSESEITTEIEDLLDQKGGGINLERNHGCDAGPMLTANDKQPINRKGQPLAYEDDTEVDDGELFQNHKNDTDLHPSDNVADNETASEMYDTFNESILQFYRRLNQVLTESRKEARRDVASDFIYSTRGTKLSKKKNVDEDDENASSPAGNADDSPAPLTHAASTVLQSFSKYKWKILIISTVCGLASMCMLWFALGCYGFYVLVIIGGYQTHHHQANGMQQPSNIVIKIMTTQNQKVGGVYDAAAIECTGLKGNEQHEDDEGVSITLDEWKQLKVDVDEAIGEL